MATRSQPVPPADSGPDLQTLLGLRPEQAVELFTTLPCPTVAELDGEYAATLLDVGGRPSRLMAHFGTHNPRDGHWLGKAFCPRTDNEGEGYNFFDRGGRLVRAYRMRTVIASSRYDQQPAYQLLYAFFPTLLGQLNMVDEIRRLGPGRYLGIGTFGWTQKGRMRPWPFVLEGPTGPFGGPPREAVQRW